MKFVIGALLLMMLAATEAVAQPAPPTNLVSLVQNTFGLYWDYTDNVEGFRIYATVLGSNTNRKVLATVPGSTMSAGHVAVLDIPSPGPGSWEVTVTAFNGPSESPSSNAVRAFAVDPETPIGLLPCTYIPSGATEREERPVGYLLIGRIIYDINSTVSKTAAATRAEQLHRWGWIGSPWPEKDPVDGKDVLRVRFWCREVPGLVD